MKGRIYDPTLGRFLQADPFIQAPNNSQNYNRYSYVLNNPMSYTDPSGFFFKKLARGLGRLWQATTGNILRAISRIPILNAAVQLGIGIACGPAAPACLGAYNAAQTYAITGSLGASIRAGAIAYATGKVFQKIGGHFTKAGKFFGAGLQNGFNHIAAHAVVGGIASTLQGGKFGHGFFSAGITKGLTPQFAGIGGTDFELGGYNVAEVTIAGIIGGTISKATGGKFANGAVTAAMGNLFNEQTSRQKVTDEIEQIKSKLEIDQEEAKRILSSLYPKDADRINKTNNDLSALATNMMATMIQGNKPYGIIDRINAIFNSGYRVPEFVFKTGVDLYSGGSDSYLSIINGTSYSNPQIYDSVKSYVVPSQKPNLAFHLGK